MRKYILLLIASVIVYLGYHYSKHIVSEDELWVERITVPEGGIIEVYHSHKCLRSKPFYIEKENKIDFKKSKYSVYDICIHEDDAKMLNSISKTNINDVLDRGWTYSEDIESFVRYEKEICDISNRDYEVYHSWIGKGTKKLSKPISAWSLLEDMGRNIKW
jgi:hypothetical protein